MPHLHGLGQEYDGFDEWNFEVDARILELAYRCAEAEHDRLVSSVDDEDPGSQKQQYDRDDGDNGDDLFHVSTHWESSDDTRFVPDLDHCV